jgi:hypothetical protein
MNEQKDLLMFEVLSTMVNDLRNSTKMPLLGKEIGEACAKRSVKDLRQAMDMPAFKQAPIYLAKAVYQISNFAKRYIFDNDVFDEAELKKQALHDFVANQQDVATSLPNTSTTFQVLQKARSVIKDILGPYNMDEHVHLSRFDRNASEGLKASDAYLDNRFANLTGTILQQRWLQKYMEESGGVFPHSDVGTASKLTVTAVPKSYKAARSICPNTVIGGLMSSGIGNMIERRLRFGRAKIDFRFQQEKHRKMCVEGSITRAMTTLDLSKASDNIGFVHLRRLLPSDWYRVIADCRVREVSVGEQMCSPSTFMTMGIGYTFPLQTLVFYALIQAIADLTNTKGVVSVFGDDCIYPSRIHKYVIAVFKDIGFVPNLEKTFNVESFRESCGADLYRGVDIRPTMPKTDKEETFEQFAYKVFNTLFARWDRNDLPKTHESLLWNIAAIRGVIYQVPMAYPDTSGIRVSKPLLQSWLLPWSPVKVKYGMHKGQRTWIDEYRFKYVVEPNAEQREVFKVYPYLWEWLRERSAGTMQDLPMGITTLPERTCRTALVVNFSLVRDLPYSQKEQVVTYKKKKINYNNIVAKIKKLTKEEKAGSMSAERQNLLLDLRRRNDFRPVVSSKGRSNLSAGPNSTVISSWTWDDTTR